MIDLISREPCDAGHNFLILWQREASRGKGDVFSRAEILQAAAAGGLPGDPEALLEMLNNGGYILQKGQRMYQLART